MTTAPTCDTSQGSLYLNRFTMVMALLLLLVFTGCRTISNTEASPALTTVKGSGEVTRTALSFSTMNAGETVEPVDFAAYTVPANGAFPANTFEGRLVLNTPGSSDHFVEYKDTYHITDSSDSKWKHLPAFSFEFVQSGSHIIPAQRGYIKSDNPAWEYILEPGRVWDEQTDQGFSRASIPFALKQRNANAVHNGVLMFLFKNDGSVSSAVYQIVSETSPYYKFDLWGIAKAKYEKGKVKDGDVIVSDYVNEVANRMPAKPIEALKNTYPGADPTQFSSPGLVTKENMTLYGFVIDGINYVGGCDTRYGTYPYGDGLTFPSYSTAKSIAAGLGMMRMEKLYPGSAYQLIKDLVPEYSNSNSWNGVTIKNALDMATGNYKDATPMADEDNPITDSFFLREDHLSKLLYSLRHYTRQSEPGVRHIYHTMDTYLAGVAMNNYLRKTTGRPTADYFTGMVVKDILQPIHTSPGSKVSQRTYDSIAQVFSGYGLFFQRDDFAKIGQFLLNEVTLGNKMLLDSALFYQVMKADKKDVLESGYLNLYYRNGFWLVDAGAIDICSPYLIPFMSGHGGIRLFLLPNGTVYYYVSDNYEYAWKEAVAEANRIRPFCR